MINLALNGDFTLTTPAEEAIPELSVLHKISQGDEKAFAVLFQEYLPVLLPFVTRFTRSEFGADEVIQNTFIRVWMNREKLEHVSNIRAWLYRYASNECLKYLRSAKVQTNTEDIESCNEAIGCHNHCTSDHVDLNELKNLVTRAVDKLPEQRKRIYLMSRNQNLSIPEIAERLGLSTNTVKNTLVTSLKAIRQYLSLHGYHFSLIFLLFFKDKS